MTKSKTQFECKGWVKFAEEDVYADGCQPNTLIQLSGTDFFSADSAPELVEKLRNFADGDRDSVLLDSCDEPGRVDVQVMEDGEGIKASEKELSEWKAGSIRLWSATYSFHVEKVKREEFAFTETPDREKGFSSIPVRFFMWDSEAPDEGDGEGDFVECDESDFMQAEGQIVYDRNSIFENGVNQICLTKNPFAGC